MPVDLLERLHETVLRRAGHTTERLVEILDRRREIVVLRSKERQPLVELAVLVVGNQVDGTDRASAARRARPRGLAPRRDPAPDRDAARSAARRRRTRATPPAPAPRAAPGIRSSECRSRGRRRRVARARSRWPANRARPREARRPDRRAPRSPAGPPCRCGRARTATSRAATSVRSRSSASHVRRSASCV